MTAKTLFGLEEVLAEELKNIGAQDIELLRRAVSFRGDQEMMYKANYMLRTAVKVLKPIATFSVRNEIQLYKSIQDILWTDYLTIDHTFAVEATTNSEYFTHSKYAALKVKDAIVDQFRDIYGKRPDIDTRHPDLRINIHISDRQCTVSLDSSGTPLGKRGYRKRQTFAPLSEVLAAGMILLSKWDQKSNFLDPMCGSGTIPIEAALIAKNISPGFMRDFGFEKWNDFDEALWDKVRKEADSQEKAFEGKIQGFDIERSAVNIAKGNARIAGVDDLIFFRNTDFMDATTEIEPGTIVMNPPYGERLKEEDEIIPFYQDIGSHLKHHYQGWDAWILSGNIRAIKFVGLKPSRRIHLFNGPMECKFHKFEMYRGSKKAVKNPDMTSPKDKS